MSDQHLPTYHVFTDKTEAAELVRLLNDNGIAATLDESAVFNIAAESGLKEYHVRIRKSDFNKADQLQDQSLASLVDSVGEDHYLFDFTDEELMDVVSKRDEWSRLDYLLSQKILAERGTTLDQVQLDELREQRMKDLSRPEKRQHILVAAGYVFSFLGGFAGIIIGWHLMAHKRTLPNGARIYDYSEPDRIHGSRIVIIGAVFLTLGLLLRLTGLLGMVS